jgi:hypothetical protein
VAHPLFGEFPNPPDNRLTNDQRLSSPVLLNKAKPSMLSQVPVLAEKPIRPKMGLDRPCTILRSWILTLYPATKSQPSRFNQSQYTQQLELDIGASTGYPLDQFATVMHKARLNQRSVGGLEDARKGAEAGICGRSLITRRSLVRVQPPLPQGKTEAI